MLLEKEQKKNEKVSLKKIYRKVTEKVMLNCIVGKVMLKKLMLEKQ